MKVVADSHALVWHVAGSERLSPHAAEVLRSAEKSEGIVVSVGTFVDHWYVSQTTTAVTADDLRDLRRKIDSGSSVFGPHPRRHRYVSSGVVHHDPNTVDLDIGVFCEGRNQRVVAAVEVGEEVGGRDVAASDVQEARRCPFNT